ncbi:hypothetical protein [Mailhella sp.]
MSVELQEQRVRYVGNGTAKTFPFSFTIEEPSQVQVVRADASGTESTLVLNSDYTVALNSNGTGSVTLKAALPKNYVLALVSNIEIDQERVFYNNTPYYQEQIEGALDKLTRICQQLHELSMRHLTVPSTSNRTPQEVMTEIVGTVATANQYAVQAEATFQEVVKTAQQVAQDKASVDVSLASINVSEANVTRLAGQVMELEDELQNVSDNMPAVQSVWENEQAIATIAADLQGYPIYEFDGGYITNPIQSMNGVGGVFKVIADNIDIIKQVAGSLENSEALLTLADDVAEIGSTDYTGIDQSGEA